MIMACTHVLEENKSIGDMNDEIKSNTVICQECIDKMTIEPFEDKNLPKEVHLFCKYCVIEKLKMSGKEI